MANSFPAMFYIGRGTEIAAFTTSYKNAIEQSVVNVRRITENVDADDAHYASRYITSLPG